MDDMWAKALMSPADYNELRMLANDAYYDYDNGYVVHLGLTIAQINDIIYHYHNIRVTHDPESTEYIAEFLANFILFLERFREGFEGYEYDQR